jgi:hypothetical protein
MKKKDVKIYQAGIDDMIARYGWAVQGVFGSPTSPAFSYTVGLAAKGLPEIIVFGLPSQVAHQFLNALGRRFTADGVPPLDVNLLDVAKDYPARLLPVPREQADQYLFAAKHRYPAYTAVQLVWTDENSRFPWDAGFDPALVSRQPILRNTTH